MRRTTVNSLDINRLRDVIDVAHDTSAISPVDVTFAVMDRVRQMIGGDWVTFHDLESAARRSHHLQATDGEENFIAGPDEGPEEAFWKHYEASSCSWPDRSSVPMVVSIGEVYSEREWAEQPMHQEYLTDVHDEILAALPCRPGVNLRLLIGRETGSLFSDLDCFLVRLLLPHLEPLLQRTLSSVVPSPETLLTGRQREIMGLVREGMTNQQVAGRLGISAGTVRKHLENSYGRLQVQSRVAAVGATFPESWEDQHYA